MVDRLARAFADREGWVWERLDRLEDTSFGWGQNHIRQHIYENIRGMREPTAAMLAALSDAIAYHLPDERKWQAMIDAALAKE
jgi:hypothetical protein